MAVVKGSKEYQWAVVKVRPHARLQLGAALLALFILGVAGAYQIGQKQAMTGYSRTQRDLAAVRAELEEVRKAEQQLRQQKESAALGAEVDRRSLEEVRQQVIELKAQIATLEEENKFYRNLMAPDGNQRGLNFGPVEIVHTDRPRTYRYKVVMQQLATHHEVLTGTLQFSVVGRQEGELRVLPLSQLSSTVDSTNIKLRFKYFQNIEGELVLPEGFEPERIELEARSTGNNATVIEKRFAWLVQSA
mgnify:CR=1 FL=1|jgi:hypothetical protein